MKKNLIVLIIVVILATVMYFISGISPTYKTPCTQEALICPDGSTVRRMGPICEFAACPKITQDPTSSPSPSITVEYQCPEAEWVNCMSILTEKSKKACSKEALEWYKNNCLNFKGAAY